MSKTMAVFQGVTTPISDLIRSIQAQGWSMGQIKFDTKLNAFTATAVSPHGEQITKTGPDDTTAVANALLAVTRRNHMRTTAQFRVGMWRTNFHDRLQEIAEAYRDAPIYDPKAVAAWKALGDDSVHRLAVLAEQLHIEPTNDPQPYATADDMRKDVHEKRHYYLTRAGAAHPVWTSDQVAAFRAVHDILGHGVAGGQYDWPGRNLAANAHFPLVEPIAQQALFTEAVARPAYSTTYGHGPQKIVLFPEFVDPHQGNNNPSAHRGIHPSQVTAPVAAPTPFALSKTANGATIDVNKDWDSGIDPLQYNAYIHHGDPMEAKAVMDNAGLINTGWAKFQKGDGSDDRERMRQAVVNAFRVVLLSPRKDLRWNAIHYQHIADIPGGVDDPKVYWDKLESERRKWNEAQGIDPEAHMIYYQFLKPFEARIAAQHPEKGWEWAKQEAKQTLFNWWTEEQERIQEEDSQKPPEKQRHADEIERRANEALARRLQLFLKPKSEKHDVEDTQMSMFGARKEADDFKKMMDALAGPPNPAKQPENEWTRRRDEWAAQRDRERAEERALFERDPQAYYHKMWGGRGDVDHPYHGQFVEWVPIQHVLPYAEWKRNPAHGAPEGESATQQYWDILKNHILEHGIQDPIQLYIHPADGMGHIAEGNHRLAVADALGMTHVPLTVHESKRRGNVQVPVPGYDRWATLHDEIIRPSQVGFPTQKTAAGGQYNLLTGEEALKYGAFMGTHLKAIAQISQHADEILDSALEDVREHDGTGHHFRHAVLSLSVPGVGPKVCSFAWLLLQPLTSQLGTIDTHMMDVLGHHYEKEMNNRDYFKFERELAAGRDAAGYGHVPLGAFQWGMWDYKRTGPGSHQDHSAMAVLDPKPHAEVDWVSKAVNLKGESWHKLAPDWWQNTQPAREAVAQEWDDTYAKNFAQNQIPYQGLATPVTAAEKRSYDHDFSYYWDRSMPVGASLDSKARTLAEHARADDMSDSEFEDWLEDHKSDTKLASEAFKRFKKKALRKFDRLSHTASDSSPVPSFIHPHTLEAHHGMPGQSLMEHARLQTGLSTQDVWRLLADEHVQKHAPSDAHV